MDKQGLSEIFDIPSMIDSYFYSAVCNFYYVNWYLKLNLVFSFDFFSFSYSFRRVGDELSNDSDSVDDLFTPQAMGKTDNNINDNNNNSDNSDNNDNNDDDKNNNDNHDNNDDRNNNDSENKDNNSNNDKNNNNDENNDNRNNKDSNNKDNSNNDNNNNIDNSNNSDNNKRHVDGNYNKKDAEIAIVSSQVGSELSYPTDAHVSIIPELTRSASLPLQELLPVQGPTAPLAVQAPLELLRRTVFTKFCDSLSSLDTVDTDASSVAPASTGSEGTLKYLSQIAWIRKENI